MNLNKKTTTAGETVSIAYRHGEADFSDLVHVVRCKDCKKSENNGHGCARYDAPVEPDDFCSYGERKGRMITLISKEDAIAITSGYCHPTNIATELAKLPEAVVRCWECEHWIGSGLCKFFSMFGTIRTTETDYCSHGERREDT